MDSAIREMALNLTEDALVARCKVLELEIERIRHEHFVLMAAIRKEYYDATNELDMISREHVGKHSTNNQSVSRREGVIDVCRRLLAHVGCDIKPLV